MTDMAVTSTNVRALVEHGAQVVPGIAGATVTIGYLVYQDSSGKWQHADGNVSLTLATVLGVAVESYDGEDTVISGNALSVCILGPVTGFDALTSGALYYLSNTVGRLADAAGAFNRIIGNGLKIAGFVCLNINPQLSDAASS